MEKDVSPSAARYRFQLNDDLFNQWWKRALYKDEAAEYVHSNLQGTLDGARFVCALDYLTGVENRSLTTDIIVDSYALAKNLPAGSEKSAKTRIEAQAVYDDPATQYLIDCLRRRQTRVNADRIANMRVAKLEELYDRGNADRGWDSYQDKLATEKLFLSGSAQFIDNSTKERSMEAARRDKAVVQRAIRSNSDRSRDTDKLPSPEEAKQFILMLRDAYGSEKFAELMGQVALPSADK